MDTGLNSNKVIDLQPQDIFTNVHHAIRPESDDSTLAENVVNEDHEDSVYFHVGAVPEYPILKPNTGFNLTFNTDEENISIANLENGSSFVNDASLTSDINMQPIGIHQVDHTYAGSNKIIDPLPLTTVCIDKEKTWPDLFCQKFDDFSGYTSNYLIAEDLLKRYQLETDTKFCVWNSPKNFGSTDIRENTRKKVLFNERHTAYIVLSIKRYTCEHGKDRHKAEKLDSAKTSTKKGNCTASITLRDLLIFPKCQVKRGTHWEKRMISTKIRKWLTTDQPKNSEEIPYERCIHVSLPKLSAHQSHKEKMHKEAIHPLVLEKIAAILWKNENTSVDVLIEKLQTFAQNTFNISLEDFPKRRRYCPSTSDLKYLMTKVLKFSIISNEDKIKVKTFYEEITSKKIFDKFYLCESISKAVQNEATETEQTGYHLRMDNRPSQVLFIYESYKAQSLLFRYGKQIFFRKVSQQIIFIPFDVFVLYVQTNVDYQPIALFLCQKTDVKLFVEILELVKSWNKFWKPQCVFIEKNKIQEDAFKIAFPDSNITLNPSIFKHEWTHWLHENVFGDDLHETFLNLLDELLYCVTHESFLAVVQSFTIAAGSTQKSKVFEWFGNYWLPFNQKWRVPGNAILNQFLLEDEEQMFVDFKFNPFHRNSGSTWLHMLLKKTVNGFEDSYTRYKKLNEQLHPEKPNNPSVDFTSYLLHPQIKNFLSSQKLEAESMDGFYLSYRDFGVYELENTTDHFRICFVSNPPSCTCQKWEKYKLPCQHMFFVFHHVEEWSYNRLPISFIYHPLHVIDSSSLVSTTLSSSSSAEETSLKKDSTTSSTITSNLSNLSESTTVIEKENEEEFIEPRENVN